MGDNNSNNTSSSLAFSMPYENSTTIDVLRRENERLKRIEAEEKLYNDGNNNNNNNIDDLNTVHDDQILYQYRNKQDFSIAKVKSNNNTMKKISKKTSKKKSRTKLHKSSGSSSNNNNNKSKVKSKKKTVSNDARNDDNIDITNANGKETEQIQNWENEAQAILQKRLDGLLQTTVNTSSNN